MSGLKSWLKRGKEGSFDILKDPHRETFLRLSSEYDKLSDELKRLQGFIETLDAEYESCKMIDFIRRYNRLKGMIKRIIMHTKMPGVASVSSGAQMGIGGALGGMAQGTRDAVKRTEQARRREDQVKKMTNDEVNREIKRLEEGVKDIRSRVAFISDSIRKMESQYEDCRQLNLLLRYQALKKIVKGVTKNSLLRDV